MAKSDNSVRLKYAENIYDVEFQGNQYKYSVIEDWDTGDFEVVVMKYNNRGELVAPTQKQREAVLEFFDEEAR